MKAYPDRSGRRRISGLPSLQIGGLPWLVLWPVLFISISATWANSNPKGRVPPSDAPQIQSRPFTRPWESGSILAQATEPRGAPGGPTGKKVPQMVETTFRVVKRAFGGQEITVGVVNQTVQLNLFKDQKFSDGATPKAKLTNNGKLDLVLRYKTSESYLVEEEMRVGWFRIGYDFEVHFLRFRTDRQKLLNELEGEDIGTAVSGQMVGGGPLIFVRLGPLYPGSRFFWKAGGGAGAGLIRFEGNALFRNNASSQTSLEPVTHRASRLNLFVYGLWTLEWENWRLIVVENNLRGDTDFGRFLFQESSIILGYTLQF